MAPRRRNWLNDLDGRLRRALPRSAYKAMLDGYHGARRLTGRNPGRGHLLPDFVIIGAAKAGTTTLYAWLCDHDYVERSRVKEVHYFSFHPYRGEDWYRQHFPLESARREFTARHGRPFLTGEASPTYMPDIDVPGRLADTLPSAKLIVSLRDPVDRAYSQFQMRRRDDKEPVSDFFTACALEDPSLDGGRARAEHAPEIVEIGRSFLRRGRYAEQLERWFARFPRERFHIISMDDMESDPRGVRDGLDRFLDLPARDSDPREALFANRYEPMDEATREQLSDHFRADNARLYELLGRDFGWPA